MNKVIQLDHRKSKITLCSTDYIDHVTGDLYFYVEAYHFEPIDGANYLDMLAPSLELYSFIQDAVQDKKFIKQNSKIFKERYKQQLKSNVAVHALKRIEYYLQQGKDIVLFCDPVDLRFNHLITLGNYFKQLDYRVDFKITLAAVNSNLHNLLVKNILDYL